MVRRYNEEEDSADEDVKECSVCDQEFLGSCPIHSSDCPFAFQTRKDKDKDDLDFEEDDEIGLLDDFDVDDDEELDEDDDVVDFGSIDDD